MPVLPRYTSIFSIDNAAITPLLTDPIGGTATYGTKIDVPGIRSATLDPEILAKELFGDNAIQGRAAKARQIMSKVEAARLNLDILALLMGGAVTEAGTTPAQTTTYNLLGSSAGSYFKLEYRVLGVELPNVAGGGDLHVVFWKAKITSTALPTQMEEFAPHSFDVAAIARLSDSKLLSLVENETALSIT